MGMMLGRVAPATLTVCLIACREKKGIWTSKYMAPHDSAAKNKGEYDSCIVCYFRDERWAQRGMMTTAAAMTTTRSGEVSGDDRTVAVGTMSRRRFSMGQRQRR